MKFGLCCIPDHHAEYSGSWSDWYEGMIAEVRLAEALGFDSAWFAEHRVPGFAFGSPARFIAARARATKRIRLAASVSLLSLNNPVRTAEDYAMADVLSHGRLARSLAGRRKASRKSPCCPNDPAGRRSPSK